MIRKVRSATTPASKTIRCAIYTRKSSEDGLEQEFNSLDAQRESGEAYIKSQASEGWVQIPDTYDDGGFTGGNMERPGLAIHFDGLIQSGAVANYSELAQLGNVTRARMTQIMNLLMLAPEIQEELLFLPRVEKGRGDMCLRDLLPVAAAMNWEEQRPMLRAARRIS